MLVYDVSDLQSFLDLYEQFYFIHTYFVSRDVLHLSG